MRLRPYRQNDAEMIGRWIDDELTHAYWRANTLPYPFDARAFETNRKEGDMFLFHPSNSAVNRLSLLSNSCGPKNIVF